MTTLDGAIVRKIADLREEIDRLSLELKQHEAEVKTYLTTTGSTRIASDDYEAVLRQGKPSFDYDGLLAALGEHLSPADRAELLPFDRPCRMCHGAGREPGVVNGTVAKRIRSYAPQNGIDYAKIIDAHTTRAEPTLSVVSRGTP